MRPIAPGFVASVNQMLPSGPVVMPVGLLFSVSPAVYSVNSVVFGLNLPIFPGSALSVNHASPSGPNVIPAGLPLFVGVLNSVISWVDGTMRRIVCSGGPWRLHRTWASGRAGLARGLLAVARGGVLAPRGVGAVVRMVLGSTAL